MAMVLGGGTTRGLWSDHLLEIAMLPALFLGLGNLSSTRLSLAGRIFAGLVVLVLLAQFVPHAFRPEPGSALAGEAGLSFFSPAAQNSLEAALYAVSILGFFLYMTRFSDAAQERCLRFLMIGFLVNFVAGVLQLSYGQRVEIWAGLPYAITAGVFANENHFSGLIYLMIPLLAHVLVARSHRMELYICAAILIVGFLFAVGSRAGMAIAGTLSVLCLFWFSSSERSTRAKLAALSIGIVVFTVFAIELEFRDALDADLRSTFYATTLKGIADYWLTGSGLGSFTLIYPGYESHQNIVSVFANHAHNDFLEIALETGIIGAGLIGLFLILIARNAMRSGFAEAALLSVTALCLHSLVDYPLRTMGLAVPFAYLAAVILSARPFAETKEPPPAAELLKPGAERTFARGEEREQPVSSGVAPG